MEKIVLIDLATDETCRVVDRTLRYRALKRKPKLGLQYLCAVIEQHGYQCEVRDQQIAAFTATDIIEAIVKTPPLFVGFYSHSFIRDKLIQYITKIREVSSVPIVIGGPGAIHARDFLAGGCDIVVCGEGEKTVVNVIEYLKGRKPLEEIKGIVYKRSGAVADTGVPELIGDLDEIPFPDREKTPIKEYYDKYILTAKYPYVTMITSRGCPHRCVFCNSPDIWQGRFRVRSVGNVIAEIDSLVARHDIGYIAFQDDIFGWRQDWLDDFCHAMIAKSYRLHWMCILHPLSVPRSKEKTLALMKRAGCDFISFGLQSADPAILRNINRNPEEPHALAETVSIAKKQGIFTNIDFIVGLIGDTVESVETSIRYALKVRPHLVNFHPIVIIPGTALEEIYKRNAVAVHLGESLLAQLVARASRKFYLNPANVYQIFAHVARNNPARLFDMPIIARPVFDMIRSSYVHGMTYMPKCIAGAGNGDGNSACTRETFL